MAVFVASGDESDGPTQRGTFVYSGFVAPFRDWADWFAPAWEERVLNRNPPIPFLHMASIRSAKWRRKYGLTDTEAERRVDEAVAIIRSMGSLHPLRTLMDGGHFRDVFRHAKVARRGQPGGYQFEPDHLAFLGFAYAALDAAAGQYPDAEKVDFLIERKSGITNHIGYFLDSLAQALSAKGRSELIPLIGELVPGGKERIPLQAADVAAWHFRRDEEGLLDRSDLRRMAHMLDGRMMTVNGLTPDQITTVAARLLARTSPGDIEFKLPRVKSGGEGV